MDPCSGGGSSCSSSSAAGEKHSCSPSYFSFIRCQSSPKLGPHCARTNTTLKREHDLWYLLAPLTCKSPLAAIGSDNQMSSLWWGRWYVWPWHCSMWKVSDALWATPGWPRAAKLRNYPQMRIIPKLSRIRNYPQIIFGLPERRQEPMVVLVLCHEIFIIPSFNPLSVADCHGCPWNENNWM